MLARTKKLTLTTALTAAVIAVSGQTQAATLSASDLLNQFGVIVKGDLSGRSEAEGRVLVGGDLGNLGNTNYNTSLGGGVPASDYDELVVLGEITGRVKVDNGGDLSAGSLGANADVTMNGGGTQTIGTPVNAPERFGAVLDRFSDDLVTDAATPNGTAVLDSQNLTFTADAIEDVTYFNVAWTDLYSNNGANVSGVNYDLNGNDDAVLVINVSGTTGAFSNNNADADLGQHVIWNFYEADEVVFDRRWVGAILAGDADVTLATPVEGSIFANNLTLDGEQHRQNFVGLPEDDLSAVPLPAGGVLLLTGLIGLAVARRRQA